MRNHKLVILLLMVTFISAAALAAKPSATFSDQAVTLVNELATGNYAEAEANFNARMQQGLPTEKLKVVWEQITTQAGAFQKTGETQSVKYGSDTVILVKTLFKNGALWTQVAFDPSGKIAGLYFKPAS